MATPGPGSAIDDLDLPSAGFQIYRQGQEQSEDDEEEG
jgi:hypothetical protein